MGGSGVDPARVAALKEREDAAFLEARPRSRELWAAGQAVMPNGVPMSWLRTSYDHLPLFVAEGSGAASPTSTATSTPTSTSPTCPCSPAMRRRRWSRRSAVGSPLGAQFLLPTEDSIWVAGELGRRYGLPLWQFTLAATSANTEVIRIARTVTGRDKVLFFDGKYHGHFDEALVELVDGQAGARGGRAAARRDRPDPRWCRSTTSRLWSGRWRTATSPW